MKHDTADKKSTSWALVVFLLLVFPLFFAAAMRYWMGVPSEVHRPDRIFGRLEMEEVPLLEQHSLHYDELFFCRLRLHPDGLKSFYQQLESFKSYEGRAQKPISLKFEREWWDPDLDAEGRYWEKGETILWSPADHPDLFYGTARLREFPDS